MSGPVETDEERIEGRLYSLEDRMTKVEDRVDGVEGRLGSIETKLDKLIVRVEDIASLANHVNQFAHAHRRRR